MDWHNGRPLGEKYKSHFSHVLIDPGGNYVFTLKTIIEVVLTIESYLKCP